jgi:hypothetical protein
MLPPEKDACVDCAKIWCSVGALKPDEADALIIVLSAIL